MRKKTMKLYDWRRQVTGWLVFLLCCLPGVGWAGEYQSTLLVQTGMLRESDLIVRIVADLESSKICLTFYVRTVGTSPAMTCYNAESGFRSRLNQVGFFKEDKLIVRKVRDEENGVSCLVTYVSAQGTAPAIDCYKGKSVTRETLTRNEHLREGDLDVHRILDPESNKTCLVAYVSTGGDLALLGLL